MRCGSPDGRFDPNLPLLSDTNALAFQALIADYSCECLKAGEDIGDKDEIRSQLGIHVNGDTVTFAIPRVLMARSSPERLKTAAAINRRYQPRRNWPWGPSCVDDVLRRSQEPSKPAETADTRSEAPPETEQPIASASLQDTLCPDVSVVLETPATPPTLEADCSRNDTCDTPIARRQRESDVLPDQSTLPLSLSNLPYCEPEAHIDIDDDPFEMPPETYLGPGDLQTPRGSEGPEESLRTPGSTSIIEPGDLGSPSPQAIKVKPCSRCTERDLVCVAPQIESGPRKKRPACVRCVRSHTSCDMRLVTEEKEQEFQYILDMLEKVEESYKHDVPHDISPWMRMLEATAKRLQEVEW